MTLNNLNFNGAELKRICQENGVVSLAVFGSIARGEDKPASDVDLLATFSNPKSLFELVDLEDKFSSVFKGKKTDLVTEGFLSPFIRDSVKKELKVIYNG